MATPIYPRRQSIPWGQWARNTAAMVAFVGLTILIIAVW